MKTLIIIPARYGSTRLPGKPMVKIAGKTLLERVAALAGHVADGNPDIKVAVATDDERIGAHADELGVSWVMTSEACPTGTDRVLQAMEQIDFDAEFILNLQGDAPLTPPDFIEEMINAFDNVRKNNQSCDVVTPVCQLTWQELDLLREQKQKTPFSGTTVAFHPESKKAFWFSKTILPAIRKEKDLRALSPLSPVWRHVGLYGYSKEMLKTFVTLPAGRFEELEGLEQLRVIEHGYTITCVPVDYKGRANATGVDSPEDVVRVEALIAKHGELV